jgi:hypothetical protein
MLQEADQVGIKLKKLGKDLLCDPPPLRLKALDRQVRKGLRKERKEESETEITNLR